MKKLLITSYLLIFINILCFSQVDTSDYNKFVREQNKEFQEYKDLREQEFKDFVNGEKDWIKVTTGKDVDVEIKPDVSSKNKDSKEYIMEIKDDIIAKDNPIEKPEIETFVFPIKDNFRFSSKFGYRFHPIKKIKKFHSGVDLSCKRGTNIYAIADGKVIRSSNINGYGNYILIKHANGVVTAYAHLNRRNVRKGDVLSKNDVIGTVGSTGFSTGPHLHFEIIKNSKKINPAKVFAELN